ncbi:MAG: 4Fe-4S dicluster domain-containing protein [Planctomycetota bacterium]
MAVTLGRPSVAFALLPGDRSPVVEPLPPIDPLDPAAIDQLLDRGIVGDRVGCPKLVEQLTALKTTTVDRVIVNLIPAFPVQTPALSLAWCADNVALMATGLKFLRKLCKVSKCTIATDNPAGGALAGPVRRAGRVRPLRPSFPQGDPHVLIYTLTGRKLPVGALPIKRSVMIVDAAAVIAIADAAEGRRQTHVPIQIDGRLIRVPVGTPLGALSDTPMLAGDLPRNLVADLDHPIGRGELVFRSPPTPPRPADVCIRCGWCLDACPAHIHPVGLGEAAQLEDKALATKFGIEHCIECGNCEAVCPSRLPLLEAIRSLR